MFDCKEWAKRNRKKLNIYQREWYKKNKHRWKFYKKNKEKIAEYQKQYHIKNKEKIKDYQREWIKKNPNYYKDYYLNPLNHKRRKQRVKKYYKKRNIWRKLHDYNLTYEDYKTISKECFLCGFDKYRVDIHHKDMNSNNNIKTNLIGLCPNCHLGIHRGKIKNPF